VDTGVIEVAHRRIKRVPELLLAPGEIGDSISLPDRTAVRNRTAGVQQCLGKLSFAGMTEPDEAHVANVSGSIGHSVILPLLTP
jgi:hypothetical protein